MLSASPPLKKKRKPKTNKQTKYLKRQRKTFICMDYNMEAIPGMTANANEALFCHAEAT